eukprot:Gb_16485 [translate_table: standard]
MRTVGCEKKEEDAAEKHAKTERRNDKKKLTVAEEKLNLLLQKNDASLGVSLPCKQAMSEVVHAHGGREKTVELVPLELKRRKELQASMREDHKGKTRDTSSPKEGDKPVEESLLMLICALVRLAVELDALQTCNVGKSMNHLRNHKNMEIEKKARNLVDTCNLHFHSRAVITKGMAILPNNSSFNLEVFQRYLCK